MKKQSYLTPASGRELVQQLMGLAAALSAVTSVSADEVTGVKSYLVPTSTDYKIQPLLSVGEQVPNTSDPSKVYQMVGIPDGLGANKLPGSTHRALHEPRARKHRASPSPTSAARSTAVPLFPAGCLARSGCVISGERAYDVVVDEANGITLPAAQVDNTTPGFGRFCSGFALLPRSRLRPSDVFHQ